MAADPNTGYDPDTDQDLMDANARFEANGDKDKAIAAQAALDAANPKKPDQQNGLQHWFTDLPQNIGSGLINAAVNTADVMHSGLKYIDKQATAAHYAMFGGNQAADERAETAEPGYQVPTPEFDDFKHNVQQFRSKYIDVPDPTLSDTITQGIAQLAIPGLGWSKAIGVAGNASKLVTLGKGLMSEAATMGTAVSAHADGPAEGRFADMLALGKHVEGKLGDAMNTIAPDGSLMNSYIDYMTNNKDEGEWEGHLKNIVDGVTGSAVLSPILSGIGKTLKGGMEGLKYAIDNGVPSTDRLSIPNQDGKIVFHGTGADFNDFSNDKIGSGEGAQVYGHGLYFAENPDVANHYAMNLAASNGNPVIQVAQRAVAANGGDNVAAYKAMQAKLSNPATPDGVKEILPRAMAALKAGNATAGKGTLMHVDIPDEHLDSMMHWDKPLSEQPQAAQDVFNAHGISDPDMKGGDAYKALASKFQPEDAGPGWYSAAHGDVGSPVASKVLDDAGVKGIKYLDGTSRGKESGSSNIVLFNGKNAKIVAKNGESVRGAAQDMTMTAGERAAERERVARERDREENGGDKPFEPEIIPRNAAEAEGEAARRDRADPNH